MNKNEIQKIKKYVTEHSCASYPEAKAALNLGCSDVTYYKWRKQFRKASVKPARKETTARGFKPRGPSTETFSKMAEVLVQEPKIKYAEYKRRFGTTITGGTFSRYKDAILNDRVDKTAVSEAISSSRKRRNLYVSVFTASSESVPPGAKALLKSFIESLNQANRASMELVEYADPKILEVRERA